MAASSSADHRPRVSFADERCVFIVERLPFVAIMGDLRDPLNPNFCAIGMARSFRLSALGKQHCRNQLAHLLSGWWRVSREQRAARERSRSRRGRELLRKKHRPSSFAFGGPLAQDSVLRTVAALSFDRGLLGLGMCAFEPAAARGAGGQACEEAEPEERAPRCAWTTESCV